MALTHHAEAMVASYDNPVLEPEEAHKAKPQKRWVVLAATPLSLLAAIAATCATVFGWHPGKKLPRSTQVRFLAKVWLIAIPSFMVWSIFGGFSLAAMEFHHGTSQVQPSAPTQSGPTTPAHLPTSLAALQAGLNHDIDLQRQSMCQNKPELWAQSFSSTSSARNQPFTGDVAKTLCQTLSQSKFVVDTVTPGLVDQATIDVTWTQPDRVIKMRYWMVQENGAWLIDHSGQQ